MTVAWCIQFFLVSGVISQALHWKSQCMFWFWSKNGYGAHTKQRMFAKPVRVCWLAKNKPQVWQSEATLEYESHAYSRVSHPFSVGRVVSQQLAAFGTRCKQCMHRKSCKHVHLPLITRCQCYLGFIIRRKKKSLSDAEQAAASTEANQIMTAGHNSVQHQSVPSQPHNVKSNMITNVSNPQPCKQKNRGS